MDKREQQSLAKGTIAVLVVAALSLVIKDGYTSNLIIWMAIAALIASSLRFVLTRSKVHMRHNKAVRIGWSCALRCPKVV